MYKILRFFFKGDPQLIRASVTLEEAREHCRDPETSWRTCKRSDRKKITKDRGPWFDGYTER